MRKWFWTALAAVPLVVAGGLVYANAVRQGEQPQQLSAGGYTCPVTGEELPCPACCPYQQDK